MHGSTTTIAALGVFAALALGCVADDDPVDGESDSFGDAIAVTPTEAALVLALVNAPSTDRALLDDAVGLNSLAADHIVLYRDGADGAAATADDDLFESLEELDSVKYVGPVALEALLAYVAEATPGQGEIVEGVEFTSAQVAAVVWGVNQATLAELDDELALPGNTASNLFSNAPYASVGEMGAVPYVGPSALETLRAHADAWAAEKAAADAAAGAGTYDGVTFDAETAIAALEIANEAALSDLTDRGMWRTGAEAIVENRPHASLAGVAETYGVGPATMQSLHDLAASGEWPWALCEATISATTNPWVDAYDAASRDFDPGVDYTKFHLASYGAPTCIDATDPDQLAALRATLIDFAGWEFALDEPGLLQYGPVTSGAAPFLYRLNQSLDYASDYLAGYLADGSRPDAQADYDALAAHKAEIEALVTAHPDTTHSFRLDVDAEECSMVGALVVDSSTGLIVVIYRGPQC